MALKTVREVLETVKKNPGKRCFFYFVGSPDENNESWCPDCRKAKLFVEKAMSQLPRDAVFFSVHTGNRLEWKNKNNEFRVAPNLNVSNVPTLLEFGKTNRLVEEQLFNVDSIVGYFKQ